MGDRVEVRQVELLFLGFRGRRGHHCHWGRLLQERLCLGLKTQLKGRVKCWLAERNRYLLWLLLALHGLFYCRCHWDRLRLHSNFDHLHWLLTFGRTFFIFGLLGAKCGLVCFCWNINLHLRCVWFRLSFGGSKEGLILFRLGLLHFDVFVLSSLVIEKRFGLFRWRCSCVKTQHNLVLTGWSLSNRLLLSKVRQDNLGGCRCLHRWLCFS